MGKDDNSVLLLVLAAVVLLLLSRKEQPQGATITNAETWEWTDWQGNTRQVKVHREVHQQ